MSVKRYVFKKGNKDLYYNRELYCNGNKVLYCNENKVYPIFYYDKYLGNNQLALFYWETDLGGYWEKEAHCSVYIQYELDKDLVIIKNYSENEGILDWLFKNDIITKCVGILDDGYVDMPICKLNLKYFKEYKYLDDLKEM